MASDWQYLAASNVAAPRRNALVGGPFGSNLVSNDYVDSGVPVIRGQNMGSRWVSGQFAYVTESKAKSLEANLARPGDLVFTQRGTLGQVALVPEGPFEKYLISQSQMKLTTDQNVADSLFLYYVFMSQDQQDFIRQNSIQTGVPHTNLGILRNTPIPVPPIEEQRKIAVILGALDDKIELNLEMNETLEAMARALFKSWFVDLDPVRAKAEDRNTGLPDHIATLFPDSLEESSVGEIPTGWTVEPIGNLTEVIGGTTPSTKEPGYWTPDMHAWATPKDLSNLQTPVLLKTERRVSDTGLNQIGSGLLPKGTILLSSRAPIGYLAVAEIPVAINQGFIAMKPREGVSNLFLLYWAEVAQETIRSRANGSTFLEISKSSFRQIEVVRPDTRIMRQFDAIVRGWYEKIVNNERQSATIASIRDALLPKLITGEIRLNQKEERA